MTFSIAMPGGGFLQFIRGIKSMANDAKIVFDEMGVRCSVVDPASACMVRASIDKGIFSTFNVKTEQELGVDIISLESKLSGIGTDETVTLAFDVDAAKLNIQYGLYKYSLGILDPTSIRRPPKIPRLELPVTVSMPAEIFKNGVKRAGDLSEYLLFEVDNTEFRICSESQIDTFEMNPGDEVIIRIDTSYKMSTVFSIEYLKLMAKVFDGNIELKLGQDLPVQISNHQGGVEFEYMLAPRVED
jgi:proliferating cell nuclear antigen